MTASKLPVTGLGPAPTGGAGRTARGPDELSLWRALGAEWRQLGGGFRELGFSFEWHDLVAEREVDWSRSFHPASLEICLNLAGHGHVAVGAERADFRPQTVGFYYCGVGPVAAGRRALDRHRFITVELSRAFLNRHLEGHAELVHPVCKRALNGGEPPAAVGPVSALNHRQRQIVVSLRDPPVLFEAQVLWFQSKALELMVELLFQPAGERELFCARAKRVARERVEKAVAVLRRDLANPPSLEELGREVGCNPFYLSRTFSAEMSMTIPQYLRQIRMERAADLLRAGRHNVTEAAMEVGYSSLSHFSQAFHQVVGCCPRLYPVTTGPQQALRRDGELAGHPKSDT